MTSKIAGRTTVFSVKTLVFTALFALCLFLAACTHVTSKDHAGSCQTVPLCRKAAEQGNIDAQFNLGAMYDEGQGVKQDHAQALVWWRKAAEHSDADIPYYSRMREAGPL